MATQKRYEHIQVLNTEAVFKAEIKRTDLSGRGSDCPVLDIIFIFIKIK
jgi:hypothetical protein